MNARCLICFAAIVLPFSLAAVAESLGQELAPLAAQHEAQIKALDAERTAALARAQQRYLDDLAAAEKASSVAGKLAEVAAILKEREALNGEGLTASASADLPKALERRRNDLVAARSAVDRQFVPRYERVNADYLRSLAALEARTADPELKKQIASEKSRLVTKTPGAGFRELSEKLMANSQWDWIVKTAFAGANDWQFLADGTISTGGAHFWNWKITAPDRFEVRDGSKVLWEFKVDLAKMEAEEVGPRKAKDQKRLKYKGPIPQGKERRQGQ